MPTYIGIGFSQNPNPAKAAWEAAHQAKETVRQSVDLAIVFHTPHYNSPEVLTTINETLDHPTRMIGGSTAGLILSQGIEMRGIGILAINSDELHFATSGLNNLTKLDFRQNGSLLAKGTLADYMSPQPRQVFICLSDGLINNIDPIINGFKETLGTLFPIVAAGTSDYLRFQRTYQYYSNKPINYGAVGLLIGGHITVAIACQHGWRPLGKPRMIDQSDGPFIRTIDGKNAYSIYEEFFGQEAFNLRTQRLNPMTVFYPLGIYLEEEKQFLLRNAIDILEDGSIVCQGEVPQGSRVHLMLGNKESCKQAAMDAALTIQKSMKGKTPKFVLIFESLARYKLMGRDAFKEILGIKKILGDNVPLFGMYTYGEIAPLPAVGGTSSRNLRLQNETITLLAIG